VNKHQPFSGETEEKNTKLIESFPKRRGRKAAQIAEGLPWLASAQDELDCPSFAGALRDAQSDVTVFLLLFLRFSPATE
jgi:hypothetical protein